jgi:acyl-coenzyme A synthetase/AMP-(fatty) acid ligase
MQAVQATTEAVLTLDPAADALEFEGRWRRFGRLAPDPAPSRIKIMEDLPRTVSMKVSLPTLRALIAADAKEGELA